MMKIYNSGQIREEFRGNRCLFIYVEGKNRDLGSRIFNDSAFENLIEELEKLNKIIKRGYRGVSLEFANQVSGDLCSIREKRFEDCKYLKGLGSVVEDVDWVLLV